MTDEEGLLAVQPLISRIETLEEKKDAAEAKSDRYKLLLAIVSGFFATGLGAILVFATDVLELRSNDSQAYREYLTQEYEAGVFASDPIEYRLSRAEYLARVSTSENERDRWSNYEQHLISILEERRATAAAFQQVQQDYLASLDAADQTTRESLRLQMNELTTQLEEFEARSPEPDSTLKPRVYIHIADEAVRPVAERYRQRIQESGYLAPRIGVAPAAPSNSEMRYFRAAEKDVAAEVFSAISSASISELELRYVPGYEQGTGFRTNHFELWLSDKN